MTGFSGLSRELYGHSPSTSHLEENELNEVYRVLDEGCTSYKDSTGENVGARAVNKCALDALIRISSILENAFTNELIQSAEKKQRPYTIEKLPLDSFEWKTTGDREGCYIALQSQGRASKILKKINKRLEKAEFIIFEKLYTPKQLTQSALFDEKSQSLKPKFVNLVGDVKKKIDLAFENYFKAELCAIERLSEIEKQVEKIKSGTIINLSRIKTSAKYYALAEFINMTTQLP